MQGKRTVCIPAVLTVLLLIGNPVYAGMAFKTGIFDYGPPGPGPFLNGEFTDFVWKPGDFALPRGSTNNILSGAFNPGTDYVYGMEVLNDREGTDPVTSFIASNAFKRLITSIGWIADSELEVFTHDIKFQNNLSGVDIAAAAPVAPGFPPTIRYTFSDPIRDTSVVGPLAPRSDVFYFTSPDGPTTVTGTWENAGPPIKQVSGDQFAPAAVPEPSTLLLLGTGLAGLLGYGWRRREKAANGEKKLGSESNNCAPSQMSRGHGKAKREAALSPRLTSGWSGPLKRRGRSAAGRSASCAMPLWCLHLS